VRTSAIRRKNLKTREELLKALRESYAYGEKVWGDLTEEKATADGGRSEWSKGPAMVGHPARHPGQHESYGNWSFYLRLNGLVPHSSAGR